jgi:hypothetical protein
MSMMQNMWWPDMLLMVKFDIICIFGPNGFCQEFYFSRYVKPLLNKNMSSVMHEVHNSYSWYFCKRQTSLWLCLLYPEASHDLCLGCPELLAVPSIMT